MESDTQAGSWSRQAEAAGWQEGAGTAGSAGDVLPGLKGGPEGRAEEEGGYQVEGGGYQGQYQAGAGVGVAAEYSEAGGEYPEVAVGAYAAENSGACLGAAQGAEYVTAAGGQEEASAPGGEYIAAEYLQYLEGEIQRLWTHKGALQHQMAQAATTAYQQLSARLGEAGTGVPVPSALHDLVEELVVLQSARQYLQYLQELEALARHVERAAAVLQAQQGQHGLDGEQGAESFVQAATEAVEAFSQAMSYVTAVRQLEGTQQAPSAKLSAHAQHVCGRVAQAQATLRSLLSAAIQNRLAACSWPPTLTLGSAVPGGAAGSAGGGFRGFAGAGRGALAVLQRLMVVLLTLQRAAQHEDFQSMGGGGPGEPPLLWAAEELAVGVGAQLRHHFAEGLPTDRADKPEWLFAATLRAVQHSAPATSAFQPCIEAHELNGWYSMPVEFARAVQSLGLNVVLQEHLLPLMLELSQGGAEGEGGTAAGVDAAHALWLHFADEAIQFERRLAPLRGVVVLPGEEEEGEGVALAHPGSSLDVLFRDPQWQAAWLGAESWDAVRQLDAACDALNAWQPAQQVLGVGVAGEEGEDGFLLATPRARDVVASLHEFWPPAAAEQVLTLAGALVRRGGWAARADHRSAYLQAVPLCVLRSFRERLGRELQVAEGYGEMLGEAWLPRVGAAICAAHHMEHQLRDPQGVLLLVEIQEATATSPQQPQQAGRGAVGLLEREAAAFGALRRQWSYKLAKQAVGRFQKLFSPYRHNLSQFTAGFEDGVDTSAAASDVTAVSPSMLVAADRLIQMLNALSLHLDSVVFRDVWKAVALAMNYALFNDIATEALFSLQGSRQFDADVAALAAAFGHYTSRPAAHFKETREACKLLLLPQPQAAQVLAGLQRQPGGAQSVLRPLGVRLLTLDQAATVLMQRLDLLPGR